MAKPTLSIVSPAPNQRSTNGVIDVTGKAADNVAVAGVYYSLNGGTWTNALTTNDWANWTAPGLSLTAGTNLVQACAVDTSGNVSTTNSVKVVYVISTPVNAPATAKFISVALPAPTAPTPAVAEPASATLTPAGYVNGQYSLIVNGTDSVRYAVQISSDLADWISVETNTSPFTYVDTNAASFNQRFYRAVSVP